MCAPLPLLSGSEAQQLATYVGWRRAGWRGALVAGGLFVLLGMLVMLGRQQFLLFVRIGVQSGAAQAAAGRVVEQ